MPFYAVKVGRSAGVYEKWEECQKQTTGYSGAVYKSFKNKEDALKFVEEDAPKKSKSTETEKAENTEKQVGKDIREEEKMTKETVQDSETSQNRSSTESKVNSEENHTENEYGKCLKNVGSKSKSLGFDLCKKWFHCNKKCGMKHEECYEVIKEMSEINNYLFWNCDKCSDLITNLCAQGPKVLEENKILREQMSQQSDTLMQIKTSKQLKQKEQQNKTKEQEIHNLKIELRKQNNEIAG